jgi:hypothetical protein
MQNYHILLKWNQDRRLKNMILLFETTINVPVSFFKRRILVLGLNGSINACRPRRAGL